MLPGPLFRHVLVSVSSPFFPIQPSLHMNVGLNFLKTVYDVISHPFKKHIQGLWWAYLKITFLGLSPTPIQYSQINYRTLSRLKKLCYLHAFLIPSIFICHCLVWCASQHPFHFWGPTQLSSPGFKAIFHWSLPPLLPSEITLMFSLSPFQTSMPFYLYVVCYSVCILFISLVE